MEIVFVTAHDPRYHEGDQAATDRLANRLASLRCAVRQLSLAEGGHSLDELRNSGGEHLLHAFHAVRCGIPCREIAKNSRLPFILSAAGTDLFVDLLTPGLREHLTDVVMSSTRLILPFSGLKDWLQEHLPRCPRSVVIPPSVVSRPVTASPGRASFGLLPEHRLIVIAGGIRPVKNTLTAIQGLARVAKAYPEMRLVIIGASISSEYTKRLQDTLAAHAWASWIGQRPWNEMPWWYQEAEIVLNCSHAEGGSGSLLEAMSMGKPVVAADIPGNRGFITSRRDTPEQGTGLLYFTSRTTDSFRRVHDIEDFSKHVTWILDHPQEATVMGTNAAVWARKHLSPEQEAFHHWSLYREILG